MDPIDFYSYAFEVFFPATRGIQSCTHSHIYNFMYIQEDPIAAKIFEVDYVGMSGFAFEGGCASYPESLVTGSIASMQ